MAGGMAGGFVPDLRSSSARPVSQAFNINPNIYNNNAGPGPGPRDSYGRGQPPSHGTNMGPLPMRPATSVDSMGRGGGRHPSGGPNAPGGYRQPGGPSAERPDRSATTQPMEHGYGGSDGRNKLQKPGQLTKQPTLQDIGYVAPLEPRQHTRPSTVRPGQESRMNGPPDRPSTTGPGGRPGQKPPSRPGSAGRPSHDGLPQGPKPGKPGAPQQQPSPARPNAAQAAKPTTPKPQPAAGPPGKGPKTFDEMGIGQAPKDNDCVSQLLVHAVPVG
jgi:hypothetical protein